MGEGDVVVVIFKYSVIDIKAVFILKLSVGKELFDALSGRDVILIDITKKRLPARSRIRLAPDKVIHDRILHRREARLHPFIGGPPGLSLIHI